MSPNAWKSVSVILLTALAIWYASTVEPWGVLIGLSVCWRYLIGDLKTVYPGEDADFGEGGK